MYCLRGMKEFEPDCLLSSSERVAEGEEEEEEEEEEGEEDTEVIEVIEAIVNEEKLVARSEANDSLLIDFLRDGIV